MREALADTAFYGVNRDEESEGLKARRVFTKMTIMLILPSAPLPFNHHKLDDGIDYDSDKDREIERGAATCWFGSFEALPVSALEHGQQDRQPSCRSLNMNMVMMMMVMVSTLTMTKVKQDKQPRASAKTQYPQSSWST